MGEEATEFFENYEKFINCTTVIYGPSGCGKTTLIKDVMYNLRKHIPLVFIVCPTENQNENFKGLLPASCVYSDFVAIDKVSYFLTNLVARQNEVSMIFREVNNLENLERFFAFVTRHGDKIPSVRRVEDQLNGLKLVFDAHLQKAQTEGLKVQIMKKRESALLKVYKKFIKDFHRLLAGLVASERESKICGDFDMQLFSQIVIYSEINPRVLLIFDDCAHCMRELERVSNIKQIFYAGRHMNITTIISVQNDTSISPALRNNAFFAIFCVKNIILNYFERSKTFSKETICKTKSICDKLFHSGLEASDKKKRITKYTKLLFDQRNERFFYFQASNVGQFKIGCNALWKLDQYISDLNAKNKRSLKFLN